MLTAEQMCIKTTIIINHAIRCALLGNEYNNKNHVVLTSLYTKPRLQTHPIGPNQI